MRKVFLILILSALALPGAAQMQRNRFAWEYDADFQMIFDNREFAVSHDAYIPSGTMNTLVLAPTVGFSIQQSRRVHHRLAAGVELAYDLGSHSWAGFAQEPLLFYDAHVQARRGVFEGVAGIFPRRFMEGNYSEAFISGMYRNTDRQIEGILLKWRAQRFYAELGGDWMGQYGQTRRERFQVLSFGRWAATPWLSLGWTGSLYFYGRSVEVSDVIQNHLVEPWVRVDLSRRTGWQELSLQAGAMVGYQRLQAAAVRRELPVGGEFKLTVRRWNVGLTNVTYVGDNLMPYFRYRDSSGVPYAINVYFGTPCYSGFYDYTELAWIPRINQYLSLRIAAKFHFGQEGFLGWQQQFSLRLSLDALRRRDTTMGRCL